MNEGMQAHVLAVHREIMRRIEEALERAIVSECGVLVDRSTWPWTVEVSIAVPYGEMYYLPTRL